MKCNGKMSKEELEYYQSLFSGNTLYSSVKKKLGAKLLELRENAGFQQADVAKIVGISRTSLSYYENGERGIDIEILFKLATLYNVSIDYLFGLCKSTTPRVNYEETDEMNGLGYSQETYNLLWDSPNFNQLLDDMAKHPLFETLEKLTYDARYSKYDEIDSGYRSFLVSKVLYEMVSDIFDNWYLHDITKIEKLSKAEKNRICMEIEEYLGKVQAQDDFDINDIKKDPEKFIENEFDIHRKLEQLYIKLKKYL